MGGLRARDLARPHLCLVCGVDSGPIRTFLIVVMGGLVLASLCFWLWAWGTRRFGSDNRLASMAIEAEGTQDETKGN